MAFIFKIKPEGSSKPPIWRKVKVNESLTFLELHWIIQGIFNWHNVHLFQFSPKGWGSTPRLEADEGEDWREEPFGTIDTWPYGELYDAPKIKLHDYFRAPRQRIVYIYDFGEDWMHSVILEKVTDETILQPVCFAGKGQAPMEDCGGIWGYYEMVVVVNDRKHPEHEDMMEWSGFAKGDKWEVNEFDLEETSARLREVLNIELED